MQNTVLTIQENERIASGVYRVRLTGALEENIAPGQFVDLRLPDFYLRRPISVCDLEGDALTLIYKVVGRGTDALSKLGPGVALDALIGLGTGFDASASGDTPLLLGGGVGVPPLYYLAKALMREGKRVTVLMGFNAAEDVFYEEAFRALDATVRVATVDGSYGVRGFVTDLIEEAPSYYYACGPLPMLKAVYSAVPASGELSFEERMGCGFGACMGCSIETRDGAKRVCKDGPVFKKEVILWT